MNQKILLSGILLFAINKWAQHFMQVPHWFSSYVDDVMFLPLLLGSALWVQHKIVGIQFDDVIFIHNQKEMVLVPSSMYKQELDDVAFNILDPPVFALFVLLNH